jgi:methionine-rich copper-binding protein CopC
MLAASVPLAAGAAQAQVRLIASSPGTRMVVPRAVQVAMQFSGALAPDASGADILRLDGAKPTRIPATARFEAKRHIMVMRPGAALAAGRYRVEWHAASADAGRTAGKFAFTVK